MQHVFEFQARTLPHVLAGLHLMTVGDIERVEIDLQAVAPDVAVRLTTRATEDVVRHSLKCVQGDDGHYMAGTLRIA